MCLAKQKYHLWSSILIWLLLLLGNPVVAQKTVVSGIVTDAKTGEPIPFATVFYNESDFAAKTDSLGNFKLESFGVFTRIQVLTTGYLPKGKDVQVGVEQQINFSLEPEAKELDEVTVKARNYKYRNKDNPAVELIRKVNEHKPENRIERFDFYEYEKYEKVLFGLSNISEKFQNRKALKQFQFVFENMDTTKLEGQAILPVFIKESISEVKYRKSPKARKEFVVGNKTVAFDGYVDNQGLDAYMKYLYQDINIYDENIPILTNQFISPTAAIGPMFYKYFITDTIVENDSKYIRLSFAPRNHNDLLFQGSIIIALDSSYAVTKVNMGVNKSINLNWVRELKITQEFEKKGASGYVLVYDEFSADFGLGKKGKSGIFGERSVSYKDFTINVSRLDLDYKGDEVQLADSAGNLSENFWQENRHSTLTNSEQGAYKTIDSIKTVPAFKRTLDVLVVLFAGYKTITPYFDLGPISTFYSFNPVEGFRLRLGGRTTNAFSKKIVLEGYGAYGFKDEQWKYYGGVTYSLSKRSIYEFPVRSLKVSYQKETKIPGQELQFVQEDNILLSFKRGTNDKWIYNQIFNLEYLNEFKNHFSFTIGYKNWIQQAAGGLHYNRVDYNNPVYDVKNIQTSELSLTLRWAPNEKFYQGKTYRIPISYKNPIFTVRYTQGMKGFLGGDYNYQNLTLNCSKRFYFSQLGYTDVVVEGGKIFGRIPFPLLAIHRANQTYSYQLQSYNLMNFLEFVSDQYVSVSIDHSFNGFFLNKIPLIKKLKWREAISLKVLYGSVSNDNNPDNNPELLKFPLTVDNRLITHSLSEKPYIEGSIGIANIFKFFRVDLVKRFTYLENSDISKLGIRVRFKFDF
ncbi:DUF5686 family protein [Fluviicola taffensis]|uniref:DUF5686 and carboxypeptidase-like regulatory domain-containing protein n=1 Tax=Fluviicola taffensis TaxID=191579 RepID=UPI0031377445